MASPIRDEELIDKILEGNREAVTELILRYQDYAFNLCFKILGNREDAEETTQDCFVKAIMAISAFKKNASFKTWLYRIVYNTSLNKLRETKKYNIRYIETISDEHLEISTTSKNHGFDEKLKKERIKKALDTLNPENKVIMSLFYQENMTIEEIASITLLSPNLVKVRMHRSRELLRPILKDILMDEE